jgi:hypothetical protein
MQQQIRCSIHLYSYIPKLCDTYQKKEDWNTFVEPYSKNCWTYNIHMCPILWYMKSICNVMSSVCVTMFRYLFFLMKPTENWKELHAVFKYVDKWRMASSGMLHRVALVRTEVSEELNASFIRVTRIGELGTTLAITSNRRTLRRNTNVSTTKQKSYFQALWW